MCDYSITAKNQVAAVVGQPLVTSKFQNGGSTGFAPKGDTSGTAVCLLPGTEIAFNKNVVVAQKDLGTTAIFRQVNKDQKLVHHDVLEFANGTTAVLGYLPIGLEAVVLQLPVDPSTLKGDERQKAEADQRRAAYVG